MDADDEMSDDIHPVREHRHADWTKERRERAEESWGHSAPRDLFERGARLGPLPIADAHSPASAGGEHQTSPYRGFRTLPGDGTYIQVPVNSSAYGNKVSG